MPVVISGTNGVSGVDGTASNPSYEGTDSNTGIFFPAADTIAFAEGGTEVARFDSSGNFGIGTSSPVAKLSVDHAIALAGGGAAKPSGLDYGMYLLNGVGTVVHSAAVLAFAAGGTERARITSGGEFQFNSGYGSVATAYGCRAWVNFNGTGTVAIRASGNVSSITDGGVGTYTVNFTTAMPDANYCALVDMTPSTSNAGSDTFPITYQTTSIEVRHFEANVLRDSVAVNVSVFR